MFAQTVLAIDSDAKNLLLINIRSEFLVSNILVHLQIKSYTNAFGTIQSYYELIP